MIYQLVRDWLKNKVIAELNSGISDPGKLRENEVTLDKDFLPSSLLHQSYLIKFSEIEPMDSEATMYTVKVMIEFQFMIAKQSLANYKNYIDTYLFPVMDLIWDKFELAYSNDAISTTLELDDVSNISLSALDKTEKGGMFLMPELKFELTFAKSN